MSRNHKNVANIDNGDYIDDVDNIDYCRLMSKTLTEI
jgi:hypothetical protein